MTLVAVTFVFFFSSRRRHTRFDCDWSSDVCSSDLIVPPKQFSLELISASGGAWLGNPLSCLVTIQDTNAAPEFGPPSVLANGNFQAQIMSATGLITTIEFSTNLANWQALQTFTNTTGAFIFQDTNAPHRSRTFYRAVV